MRDSQDVHQVYKLLLMLLVVLLAPFWIPIGISVLTTTLMLLGGILAIFCMPISVIILVLGIIGIPLLLIIGVPAMTQLSLKILRRIQYSLVENSDLFRWLPVKRLRQNKEVTNSEADIEIKDSWDAFT